MSEITSFEKIDANENSLLHLMAQNGNKDALLFLLQHHQIDPRLLNRQKKRAITIAVENGHFDCVKILLYYTNL